MSDHERAESYESVQGRSHLEGRPDSTSLIIVRAKQPLSKALAAEAASQANVDLHFLLMLLDPQSRRWVLTPVSASSTGP